MRNQEGLTIGQAAKAFKLSTKTIYRRIKDGKIAFKLIDGTYGQEYRITEVPGPETTGEPGLDTALAMVKGLQEKNFQLGGQLGAAQERIFNLENQVKLLTDGRQPWWRRIFK